ncbi:MAG: transglutaminase domain-containing protein [Oscillospiraceae bacterium]
MKKILTVFIAFMIIIGHTGCASNSKSSESTPDSSAETVGSAAGESITVSQGTTEISEPDEDDYIFEFNPYVITSEYEELYGSEFIQTYNRFVDAYLNFEPGFECESFDFAQQIFSAARTCFPVFNSDVYSDYENCYDEETGMCYFNYISESKSEHEAYINEFVTKVAEIFNGNIKENDDDVIKAIKIYTAFSSGVTYNYSALDESVLTDVSPYNAIINHTGVCQSFSGAYAFLLLQAGIDANICGGLTHDASIAHSWTILKLNGKYYYADPTFENTETGGYGLLYFGMTTAEREAAGEYDPYYFNIGSTNEIFARDLTADDPMFSDLRGCDTYEIDYDSNSIICYGRDGDTFVLKL